MAEAAAEERERASISQRLKAMLTPRRWTKAAAIRASKRWPLKKLLHWQVSTSRSLVALTFDDGPTADITPAVLDILESEDVQATFFLLGREIEKRPEILERIVAGGHEVGLHGYDHTQTDLPGQMERTLRIVQDWGARAERIRPPGGRLSARLMLWALRRHMGVSLWSFDLKDSLRYEGKVQPARPLWDPSAGDVVLAHDDNPYCVSELPALIAAIRSRGLRAVRLDELLLG